MRKKTIQVITIGWISFLTAVVATGFFFVVFDPDELMAIAAFPVDISRTAAYTLGFFGFWLLLAFTSAATLFMLRSPGNRA